jgi:hypothetical protein
MFLASPSTSEHRMWRDRDTTVRRGLASGAVSEVA